MSKSIADGRSAKRHQLPLVTDEERSDILHALQVRIGILQMALKEDPAVQGDLNRVVALRDRIERSSIQIGGNER